MTSRQLAPRQYRARYVRVNQPIGDLLTNTPDGFPSAQSPVIWIPDGIGIGPRPSEVGNSPQWWIGSDKPLISGNNGIATITRATALIVNLIVQVRWRLAQQDQMSPSDMAGNRLPTPRWITDPMLMRPDMRVGESVYPAAIRTTSETLWANWIRSSLWWGMGYLLTAVDVNGQPKAGTMRNLHPWLVAPFRNSAGEIVWRIGDDNEYIESNFDGEFVIGGITWKLMVLRNPLSQMDLNTITAGVFETNAAVFGLSRQMLNYARGTFRSGIPAGYLKQKVPGLTKTKADDLKAIWMAAHGGDEKSIAVLNSVTDFVPLSISPVDAAIIEMRKFSLVDIAHAFGMSALMLDGASGNSANYKNSETEFNNHRTTALGPWAVAIQESLSAFVPVGQQIVIEFSGLLRPDTSARYENYSRAIKDGWLTVNEVRELEGLPPISNSPPADLPADSPPEIEEDDNEPESE